MTRRRPQPLVTRKLAALFAVLLAAATVALVVPLLPLAQETNEGDVAPRTLVAPHERQFESEAATQAARDQAANAVADVPKLVDASGVKQQQDSMDKLLDEARLIRASTGDLQQRLDQLSALPAAANLSNAGRRALLTLDNAKFDLLAQRADRALTSVLAKSSTKKPDQATQDAATAARIDDYLGTLTSKPGDPAGSPDTADELTGLKETLKLFVIPNDTDAVATQKARDAAASKVTPITKTYTKGQVIVAEGDRIGGEAIEALRATGAISSGIDSYDVAGGVLFALAFGLGVGLFVYAYQPFEAPVGRRMVLVGFTVVAVLVAVRIAAPLTTPDTDHHYLVYVIPVAAAAIVAASFGDLSFAAVVAAAVGLFAAFIVSTLPQLAGSSFVSSLQSLEVGAVYTAGGFAGAMAVHRAERVSRYAVAAAAVALATATVMAVFWLISTPRSNVELGWIALAASAAGIGAAMAGLAVFALLAMLLGIVTRLQLIELAQPDRPLLRRLQDEAPGTYHHSMMVGALAERGAARIGADAVVARVGAYYHDIGKLGRPYHFIENTGDGVVNPHVDLPAQESAAIIREHVTAGLDLARRHHLPQLVRDFIPQHHGTRLVTYFYRQAVGHGDRVDASAFRYAGPRPQTRETAIVMLADSCEAVVRARQASGGPSIDDLVDGVFAERLAEGQLDECDITMRELQEVAASFKATLRAVYHPRVPYPEPTAEELAGLARGDGIPARIPT
jgi:cyclic-di-AMP phosphodiesterase PgpH